MSIDPPCGSAGYPPQTEPLSIEEQRLKIQRIQELDHKMNETDQKMIIEKIDDVVSGLRVLTRDQPRGDIVHSANLLSSVRTEITKMLSPRKERNEATIAKLNTLSFYSDQCWAIRNGLIVSFDHKPTYYRDEDESVFTAVGNAIDLHAYVKDIPMVDSKVRQSSVDAVNTIWELIDHKHVDGSFYIGASAGFIVGIGMDYDLFSLWDRFQDDHLLWFSYSRILDEKERRNHNTFLIIDCSDYYGQTDSYQDIFIYQDTPYGLEEAKRTLKRAVLSSLCGESDITEDLFSWEIRRGQLNSGINSTRFEIVYTTEQFITKDSSEAKLLYDEKEARLDEEQRID